MTENIKKCWMCGTECDYPEGMEEVYPGEWSCIRCACQVDPKYGEIEILAQSWEDKMLRKDIANDIKKDAEKRGAEI